MARKKRNRFSRGRDRAKAMAKRRIGTGTPKKPNRSIKSIRAANRKRIQDNARERNAKFKQTRVQTFGGRKTRFTKSEQRRIKDAGYKVDGYSKAKFKPKAQPKVDAVGRNDLRNNLIASDYMSGGEPTQREQRDAARSILQSGMKLSDEQTKKLMQQATMKLDTASLPNFLKKSIIPNAAETGKNYLESVRDTNAADETKGLNQFFKNIQTRDKMLDQSSFGRSGTLISASNLTDLRGIMPAQQTGYQAGILGNYLAKELGLDPNTGQEVSPTATSAGGLNIGSQRTTNRTRRGRTDRVIQIADSTKPTVQEEVLQPVELPVQTASTTPATTTGVDPNKLLQIQQKAYTQAFNPLTIGGFNPQFRFGAAPPMIDYSTYFNYS